MSLVDSLPHLCTIKQSAWVQDDNGADYDNPEIVEEGAACWVQPASDRQITEFQKRDQNVTHQVYFNTNKRLKPGHFLLPTTGPFAGAYLEVKSYNETTAGLGVLFKAMCEEVQSR